jgi:copper homeostasis protein
VCAGPRVQVRHSILVRVRVTVPPMDDAQRRTAIEIEVCVEDPEGAQVAAQAGANRLEVCSALALGGVTPGPGLWEAIRRGIGIPLTMLLRPRRGDFCYVAG